MADNCNPCCDTPTTTQVPGPAGADGAAGAAGTAGVNAYTAVAAGVGNTPARGASASIPVASSIWMGVGQIIFVETSGYYEVTSKADSTHFTGTYLDIVANTESGNAITVGSVVSPGGPPIEFAVALPAAVDYSALTTAGAVSNLAVATGAGIQTIEFPHTFIGGTAAVEPVTNYTPGYKFRIVSWAFVTEVLLVGAIGSRVANMEINTTDVGTVPSTITIPIANAAVGTVTAGTAVAGANTGSATDTISIEIAAGGTQFTAGSGTFLITIQNMDTADALASISDHVNDIIASLTP